MNDNRTHSILQRLPVILAVTAASYGLPPAGAARPAAARARNGGSGKATPMQMTARALAMN